MVWYSPPSRREISLVLFSLTTFVLFYNLEYSFISGGSSASFARNSTSGKDYWDNVIYGDWTWEEALVAENARKQALNNSVVDVSFHPQVFGSDGVDDGILTWDDDVPTTTVLKHVPGHTVMDNVFMLNGTLFVVSDDPSFPPLDSVALFGEDAPRPSDLQVLSSTQARETLGSFGGVIHGVSWLVTDPSPSNYTLFSLWRTYSALHASLSPDALTLPPPRRVFYPRVPTFVGGPADPNGLRPIVERQRSPSGFHPFLVKAAFPTLGLMFQEDWEDYAFLHIPFLIKRVVIADQGAARKARTDIPAFAVPLVELKATKEWWEPIRRHVARYLDVAEEAPRKTWLTKTKTVVTYLSRQDATGGPKLRDADHKALVSALGKLGSGYTVQVVPSEATWAARMTAISQSTVVLGVYGDHLAESVFMAPSPRATVMEMFPPGAFVRDVEVSIRALSMQYVAWWESRQHGVDKLPPAAAPVEEKGGEVPIDVNAVVQAVKKIS